MNVREIMTTPVTTVRAEEDLATALQLMLWSGLRHLPVVGPAGDVIGVLSHRDVLRRRDGHRFTGTAEEAMSSPATCVDAGEGLESAAAQMSARRFGCLPVLEHGRLVGILTTMDVCAALARRAVEAPPSPTRVMQIMSRAPLTTTVGSPLLEAAMLMFESGVRHLPVVDREGAVVGMLSDRDIRSRFAGPGRDSRVEDAMTWPPHTVDESDSLGVVARLLVDRRVGAVPVVDARGRLSGIVSYLDLLRHGHPHLPG